MNENTDKYKDIIELDYKKSTKHKHMSNHDRAAQFAPFAALSGFDDEVKEVSKHADEKE